MFNVHRDVNEGTSVYSDFSSLDVVIGSRKINLSSGVLGVSLAGVWVSDELGFDYSFCLDISRMGYISHFRR